MSANRNISGLILEGICCAGKTSVLRALIGSPQFTEKGFVSSLVLSEHHTQRILEKKEREQGLTTSDNVTLLQHQVAFLESLGQRLEPMEWLDRNRTGQRFCYLLERFHLTHVCHYPHMSWDHVEDIDRRLAAQGCKLCLLTIDDATIEQRLVLNRNEEWKQYVKKYGSSAGEIVAHYSRQQRMMINLCNASMLEFVEIDTSKMTVADTVANVMNFWGIF